MGLVELGGSGWVPVLFDSVVLLCCDCIGFFIQ